MGLAQPVQRLSEAEYLQIERQAEWKSEYFDGEMFAMAGGSLAHSQIAMNLGGELRNLLKQRGCIVLGSDMRVKVEASTLYTYPDVTVVCGQTRFADELRDTVANPMLIAEVLSDSTEAYDRGKKFEHYRQIPSLLEYLLISQREPRVEQYIRQSEDDWLFREAAGLTDHVEISSLQITIALAEIFAGVKFEPVSLRMATPPANLPGRF